MTVNFDVPAKKESGLLFSREAATAHDLDTPEHLGEV